MPIFCLQVGQDLGIRSVPQPVIVVGPEAAVYDLGRGHNPRNRRNGPVGRDDLEIGVTE
jgi:hypothetical protein